VTPVVVEVQVLGATTVVVVPGTTTVPGVVEV
jgi:hypothetical protein